jgi:hypothetical protein
MTIRKLALGPILNGATVLIPGDGADPISFEIRPHHHRSKLAGQRWHLLLVKDLPAVCAGGHHVRTSIDGSPSLACPGTAQSRRTHPPTSPTVIANVGGE